MKYPFYCKQCGYKVKYLYTHNDVPQCFECGEPFPKEKPKPQGPKFVSYKGGKKIVRS